MKKILLGLAVAVIFVFLVGNANAIEWHAWGVHEATIDATDAPNGISAITGNNNNYHWNKSSWDTRTGQKAFYSTRAFNGLPVESIKSLSWDVVEGYWGNAYFNVMVKDLNEKRAILAPSCNRSSSTGWGSGIPACNPNPAKPGTYSVFEAESGWTGTAKTGWYAATWDEVKDLIIADGPFTEFPDTLNGDATEQNDDTYSIENWAAWADNSADYDADWEKDGFMITFGQSTGTNIPLTVIENIQIVQEPDDYLCSGFEPPMNKTILAKKGGRVLPLKIKLYDENFYEITDFEISTPPLIEVNYIGLDQTESLVEDLLHVGRGNDEDELVYTGKGWQFNLQTKNFRAPGTYEIYVVSGNPGEYTIDSCIAEFVIQ
jgi:hypothetical protein